MTTKQTKRVYRLRGNSNRSDLINRKISSSFRKGKLFILQTRHKYLFISVDNMCRNNYRYEICRVDFSLGENIYIAFENHKIWNNLLTFGVWTIGTMSYYSFYSTKDTLWVKFYRLYSVMRKFTNNRNDQ